MRDFPDAKRIAQADPVPVRPSALKCANTPDTPGLGPSHRSEEKAR